MEKAPVLESRFAFSADEVAQFHRDGYAGPFSLYGPGEMEKAWRRERISLLDRDMAVYQEEAAVSGTTNISNYDRHLDSTFLATHIGRPEIVDRVSSILGPDVVCWRTEFFPKYPGSEGTDWHQADTFANASGSPQIVWPGEAKEFGGTITVWCAFTDTDEETACLQFIPGSHKTMHYDEVKGLHYEPTRIDQVKKGGVLRGFFGYDYRELQIDPDWTPDEERAVSLPMRAGQFVMFWSTLMHASHPCDLAAGRTRMAFAARYVPPSVRVYPDTDVIDEYGGQVSLERYGTVVVAGEDRLGHNRVVTETTRGFAFARTASQTPGKAGGS